MEKWSGARFSGKVMDRFFVRADAWGEGRVSLGGDEAHHCQRVMRKRVGDLIEVFDGAGRWGRGAIAGERDGMVEVDLREEGCTEESLPGVTLAVAIPKGKTMELIVQKAVELGVSAIQPLVTEHTVVRVEGNGVCKKRDKWQRVALEACKQCGQNVLPEVVAPVRIERWLAERDRSRGGLIGSLAEGAVSLRAGIGRLPEDLAELDLLIGPEGDFSAAESAAALGNGFIPVTLGDITLRVETAVLFCLSVLIYELRMK